VIVVDEDVDPFDMKQVMWAVSTKVNPAGDVIMLPNMSIDVLDPASQPDGISHKMVIDATTPVPPDDRGSFGEQLANPPQTDAWRTKLGAMLKDLHKCPRLRPRHLLHARVAPLKRSSCFATHP